MNQHSNDKDQEDRAPGHHPKCFMACLEAASQNEDAVVVHAWLKCGDTWYVHAWVENDEAVLDLTRGRQPFEREAFYRELCIREDRLVRYSRLQFFDISAETGCFGPFDTEYFCEMTRQEDPGDAPDNG